MRLEWKEKIYEKLGIKVNSIDRRQWLLLLLGVDGNQPIVNEYTFHTIFFIYSISPFDVKPLFVVPFSIEIHKTLEELVSQGYINKKYSFDNYRRKEIYRLTYKGRIEANKILSKINDSWVCINDIVLKKGTAIINELISLKRTYNDRELKTILKLMIKYINTDSTSLPLKFSEEELIYLKRILDRFMV